MKGTKLLLSIIAAVIITTVGCKKDDPYVEPTVQGTVNLNISTEVNGTPVTLNSTLYDVSGYRYVPTLFKLYISNISFTKSDGTEVFAKDVELIDLNDLPNGQTFSRSYDIGYGDYTGIKFWIGVDSTMNSIDPSTYGSEHPLSLFTGTYWDWNTGYRFLMLEGVYDTLLNNTAPLDPTKTFTYHTGTNSLYAEADLSNAQQSFNLGSTNTTYNYDLVFDMNKILYNSTDTIVIKDDRVTHTTNNMPLAQKLTDNTTKAFSNDQ